jgi:hypothetical protein
MDRVKNAVRWGVALPAAFLGAILMYIAAKFLNTVVFKFGIVEHGDWTSFYIELFSSFSQGYAFLGILVYVCPTHPKHVAIFGISLLFAIMAYTIWELSILVDFQEIAIHSALIVGGAVELKEHIAFGTKAYFKS